MTFRITARVIQNFKNSVSNIHYARMSNAQETGNHPGHKVSQTIMASVFLSSPCRMNTNQNVNNREYDYKADTASHWNKK
jgi:hypothetical protein